VVHGRQAVKAYVKSLGKESHEWLLALYVDVKMQLLAVDTIARGDTGSCPLPTWKLLDRGHALRAAGFILVHNHPSGDPTPSETDIKATIRLARIAQDLDMPLLDHLIIAGDAMNSCGYF
jgi:DNA repair protein RadC